MSNSIILPAGTKSVLLAEISDLIATALFPLPDDSPMILLHGKSFSGENEIEPLTDDDELAIKAFFGNPRLDLHDWLANVDQISEAIGADIRWSINQNSTANKRRVAKVAYESALPDEIRSGQLIARDQNMRPIHLPDAVQQLPVGAVVFLNDLKSYVAHFGIDVQEYEKRQMLPAAAIPRPSEATPVSIDWKQLARTKADEIYRRDKNMNCEPSIGGIAKDIERQFKEERVVSVKGKRLDAAYIRRHALCGWKRALL